MGITSSGETKPWIISGRSRARSRSDPVELVIVLPWNQFLYAEGGDDGMRAVFTTHDVVAKGSGLASLLSDLAVQQVTRLKEPPRAERFAYITGALHHGTSRAQGGADWRARVVGCYRRAKKHGIWLICRNNPARTRERMPALSQ